MLFSKNAIENFICVAVFHEDFVNNTFPLKQLERLISNSSLLKNIIS